MGFLDNLGDIFAELSEVGKELDGLKNDLISAVMDPIQEVSSTVTDTSKKIMDDTGISSAPKSQQPADE